MHKNCGIAIAGVLQKQNHEQQPVLDEEAIQKKIKELEEEYVFILKKGVRKTVIIN